MKCKIIIRQRELQSQSLSLGSVGMRLLLDQGCIIIIITIIIVISIIIITILVIIITIIIVIVILLKI